MNASRILLPVFTLALLLPVIYGRYRKGVFTLVYSLDRGKFKKVLSCGCGERTETLNRDDSDHADDTFLAGLGLTGGDKENAEQRREQVWFP